MKISTMDVKVQMKGSAAGTLGWFNDLIDNSELVIRKTREGIPGMFLHEKISKGEMRKEHEGNSFLCHPETGRPSDEGYNFVRINGIGYIVVIPSGDEQQKYMFGDDVCFSDYPLTPACKNALEAFLQDAVEKFAEWYEVQ